MTSCYRSHPNWACWPESSMCSLVTVIQLEKHQNPSAEQMWGFTLQIFLRNKSCEKYLQQNLGRTNTLLFDPSDKLMNCIFVLFTSIWQSICVFLYVNRKSSLRCCSDVGYQKYQVRSTFIILISDTSFVLQLYNSLKSGVFSLKCKMMYHWYHTVQTEWPL